MCDKKVQEETKTQKRANKKANKTLQTLKRANKKANKTLQTRKRANKKVNENKIQLQLINRFRVNLKKGAKGRGTPLQNTILLGYGATFSIGALSVYYHFLHTFSFLSVFVSAHWHS